MFNVNWRKRRAALVVIPLATLRLLAVVPLGVNTYAQRGTAKPPTKNAIATPLPGRSATAGPPHSR
jgi:hypothetical protein